MGFFIYLTTTRATCPYHVVKDWLNLGTPVGNFVLKQKEGLVLRTLSKSLASSNDTGVSFDEIAGIIESEPLGLFKEE